MLTLVMRERENKIVPLLCRGKDNLQHGTWLRLASWDMKKASIMHVGAGKDGVMIRETIAKVHAMRKNPAAKMINNFMI